MTAAARIIQESSFAPILELEKGTNVEVMHAVVEYMQEAIREVEAAKRQEEDAFLARKLAKLNIFLTSSEPANDLVEEIRKKYNVPESASTKRFRGKAKNAPTWDKQKAWDSLTDAQRLQAIKLNFTANDMDARTFGILTKWIRE